MSFDVYKVSWAFGYLNFRKLWQKRIFFTFCHRQMTELLQHLDLSFRSMMLLTQEVLQPQHLNVSISLILKTLQTRTVLISQHLDLTDNLKFKNLLTGQLDRPFALLTLFCCCYRLSSPSSSLQHWAWSSLLPFLKMTSLLKLFVGSPSSRFVSARFFLRCCVNVETRLEESGDRNASLKDPLVVSRPHFWLFLLSFSAFLWLFLICYTYRNKKWSLKKRQHGGQLLIKPRTQQ